MLAVSFLPVTVSGASDMSSDTLWAELRLEHDDGRRTERRIRLGTGAWELFLADVAQPEPEQLRTAGLQGPGFVVGPLEPRGAVAELARPLSSAAGADRYERDLGFGLVRRAGEPVPVGAAGGTGLLGLWGLRYGDDTDSVGVAFDVHRFVQLIAVGTVLTDSEQTSTSWIEPSGFDRHGVVGTVGGHLRGELGPATAGVLAVASREQHGGTAGWVRATGTVETGPVRATFLAGTASPSLRTVTGERAARLVRVGGAVTLFADRAVQPHLAGDYTLRRPDAVPGAVIPGYIEGSAGIALDAGPLSAKAETGLRHGWDVDGAIDDRHDASLRVSTAGARARLTVEGNARMAPLRSGYAPERAGAAAEVAFVGNRTRCEARGSLRADRDDGWAPRGYGRVSITTVLSAVDLRAALRVPRENALGPVAEGVHGHPFQRLCGSLQWETSATLTLPVPGE